MEGGGGDRRVQGVMGAERERERDILQEKRYIKICL